MATNISTLLDRQDSEEHTFSTGVKVVIGLAMTLFSLLIVMGNSLVVYVYVQNKRLQIPNNYFILSLAVADILIGIFSVNFYTIYLLTGYWPLGQIPCDLWLSMDYSCCQASTWGLLAISIDRFLSIRNTVFHRNNITKKRLKNIIFGLWIASFVLWFGCVFLYPIIYGERTVEDGECYIQFLNESATVTIITAFLNFYGPIILMTVIYLSLAYTLIKRYRDMAKKSNESQLKNELLGISMSRSVDLDLLTDSRPMESNRCYTSECIDEKVVYLCREDSIDLISDHSKKAKTSASPVNLNRSLNNSPLLLPKVVKRSFTRQKQYLLHKRAITLLLLVILAFAITWFPYNLMAVIWPFCDSCIIIPWWHFGYIFCYVNSLLNPFCYAFGNKTFRTCFKKVFLQIKGNILKKMPTVVVGGK